MPHYSMVLLDEFKPGDIFIKYSRDIGDQKLITMGQWLFGYEWYRFVHAGIFIAKDKIIEMTKDGIQCHHIKDSLAGESVVRFRCKDEKVAEYAADLAANLERSEIPYLNNASHQHKHKPEYSLFNAVKSVVNAGNIGIHETHPSYDYVQCFNVPKDFYCSELIFYLYSLAYLHLGHQPKNTPLVHQLGRWDNNPSMLYTILYQDNNFEAKEIHIHPDDPALQPSFPLETKVNSTQVFKAKIDSLKSSCPELIKHTSQPEDIFKEEKKQTP